MFCESITDSHLQSVSAEWFVLPLVFHWGFFSNPKGCSGAMLGKFQSLPNSVIVFFFRDSWSRLSPVVESAPLVSDVLPQASCPLFVALWLFEESCDDCQVAWHRDGDVLARPSLRFAGILNTMYFAQKWISAKVAPPEQPTTSTKNPRDWPDCWPRHYFHTSTCTRPVNLSSPSKQGTFVFCHNPNPTQYQNTSVRWDGDEIPWSTIRHASRKRKVRRMVHNCCPIFLSICVIAPRHLGETEAMLFSTTVHLSLFPSPIHQKQNEVECCSKLATEGSAPSATHHSDRENAQPLVWVLCLCVAFRKRCTAQSSSCRKSTLLPQQSLSCLWAILIAPTVVLHALCRHWSILPRSWLAIQCHPYTARTPSSCDHFLYPILLPLPILTHACHTRICVFTSWRSLGQFAFTKKRFYAATMSSWVDLATSRKFRHFSARQTTSSFWPVVHHVEPLAMHPNLLLPTSRILFGRDPRCSSHSPDLLQLLIGIFNKTCLTSLPKANYWPTNGPFTPPTHNSSWTSSPPFAHFPSLEKRLPKTSKVRQTLSSMFNIIFILAIARPPREFHVYVQHLCEIPFLDTPIFLRCRWKTSNCMTSQWALVVVRKNWPHIVGRSLMHCGLCDECGKQFGTEIEWILKRGQSCGTRIKSSWLQRFRSSSWRIQRKGWMQWNWRSCKSRTRSPN